MSSKIGGSIGGGNWKYAHGSAHYGRNFSVKWLKVRRLNEVIKLSIQRPIMIIALNLYPHFVCQSLNCKHTNY